MIVRVFVLSADKSTWGGCRAVQHARRRTRQDADIRARQQRGNNKSQPGPQRQERAHERKRWQRWQRSCYTSSAHRPVTPQNPQVSTPDVEVDSVRHSMLTPKFCMFFIMQYVSMRLCAAFLFTCFASRAPTPRASLQLCAEMKRKRWDVNVKFNINTSVSMRITNL